MNRRAHLLLQCLLTVIVVKILLLTLNAGAAKYLAHRRAAFQPATSSSSAWLTNYTVTTVRNNFDGWVGCFFTPKANLTITDLGRWVISGNSGAHTVKILINNGTTIASASVNTSGATAGAVKYVAITPVTLTNGQQYVLASQEFNAGDQWYEIGAVGTCMVRYDKATSDDAVFSVGGTTYSGTVAGTNAFYVPVSFKFQ